MGTLTKPHTFGLAPMISKKLIQIPCSSLGLAMTSSDMKLSIYGETRLLRRPQAQTLFDAAQPIGKIHRFSEIAVTCKYILVFFGI